jgi:plasmid replication initiation protein
MYEIIESRVTVYEKYKNRNLLNFEYKIEDLKEILLGEYNSRDENIKIPKSYKRYNNFKRKVLDIAYKELKEKGDYHFEYESIKTSRTYTSIKFTIIKNGEKIRQDFNNRKKQALLSGKEKNLAMEQIRRIIERKGDTIKDKLKYEQKLFQLYLRGELKYDKDLEAIRKELEEKELSELLDGR